MISLKFVPKIRIDNNPALFQFMAWSLVGTKSIFGFISLMQIASFGLKELIEI